MTPSRAGGVAAFALALATLLWAIRHKFAIVTVAGDSMRPTLSHGDRVLVRRASMTQLRNGLVIVAERPAEDGGWTTDAPSWPGRARTLMIKRVAALPGDLLPDLPDAATLAFTADLHAESAQGHVPAGKLVLLGDNPTGSYDSRVFGYYPANRVIGTVVRTLRAS
jgi:signal peptidase I